MSLAEQSSITLVELIKKMPLGYFTTQSDSLRGLIIQSIAEAEGKRSKMKKASLAVLNVIKQQNSGALEPILIELGGVTSEKAASIAKQVEDSLVGEKK